jgi:hypothetical protein
MKDKELLRRYWLNLATAEQKEQIELRFIKDVSFCNLAEAVEDGLINDYARNRLTSEERRQFENIFLKDPVRQERVRLLQPRDGETAASLLSRLRDLFQLPAIGRGWGWGVTAAILIVIVIGGGLLLSGYLRHNRGKSEGNDIARVATPDPSSKSEENVTPTPVVSVADTPKTMATPQKSMPTPKPGSKEPKAGVVDNPLDDVAIANSIQIAEDELGPLTRGESPDPEPKTRVIASVGKDVRLMAPVECSRNCSFTITRHNGNSPPKEVFSRNNIHHSLTKAGKRVVVLKIPSDKLFPGVYRAALYNVKINGREDDMAFSFRVEAAPPEKE